MYVEVKRIVNLFREGFSGGDWKWIVLVNKNFFF